jgi:acetyl-CoA decarbonylase/synthase complex subunit alpha
VDRSKPVIVFMGNDFLSAWMAVKYMKDNSLEDKIEVAGIGSVGHDMIRFYDNARLLISPTRANKVFRLGMGDVIVLSDTCCKIDAVEEALKTDSKIITTSFTQTYGLEDRALDSVDDILSDLEKGTHVVLISDPKKAGEVAVKLVQKVKDKRKSSYLLSTDEIKKYAAKCTDCDACFKACPASLISGRILKSAMEGDFTKLAEIHDKSSYCGKCEQACPENIPLMDIFLAANPQAIEEDNFKMRPGRGAITSNEIRDIAITMFSMPSAVSIIGCGNYPGAGSQVAEMAKEFVECNLSVVVSGCIAQDVARYKYPKTGKTLFETYPALYNPRCLTNCGGCSAQALGASAPFYKLGYIAFRNPYKSALAQQADFVYRFAAVVIMWGPATDIAYAVVAGHIRAGIPVIVGPYGSKFKRYLLGNKYDRSKWWMLHGNTGDKGETEPTPEHMLIPVETVDEAIALVPKLSFTTQEMDVSRQNKFDLYLNAYKKRFGEWPDDWHLFVKKETEMPMTKKAKMLRLLEEEQGWEIDRKRGKILKAKHRDGRLLVPGDYVYEYGFKSGQYITTLDRLVYQVRKDRV